jgi:arsenate reductase (thioredoxin)
MAQTTDRTIDRQPFADLERFIADRIAEFDQISDQRKRELEAMADYVRDRIAQGVTPKLIFICTHNSRRSHFSQLWAKIAAVRFGLGEVQTYSGGTEVTAMNPRVVASLGRAGLAVETKDGTPDNPHYRVTFAEDTPGEICFSKRVSDPPNPTESFAAIMTCSHADEACPIVHGCDRRIPIRYEDPKVADDSPAEAATYDERSQQIAREMLYAFSKV